MNIKWSSLNANMKKVLVIWVDQSSCNIPISQSLVQSKVLTLFSSMKVERGDKAAGERLKIAEGSLWSLREKSHLYNTKEQGEAASADVELQQII